VLKNLSPQPNLFFLTFCLFIVLGFFSFNTLTAQITPTISRAEVAQPISKIFTEFTKSEIELKEGEVITNVLKVYNNTLSKIQFTLSVTKPKDWTTLDNRDKVYTAVPRDTIFIPIILIPFKLNINGSDVLINAFLLDEDDQQIANDYFTLRTKKKVSWKVSLKSKNKLYFKNNEKTKKLSYSITNTGNTKQDLFVNYKTLKGDLNISDTLKNPLRNPNLTLNLNADETEKFNYLISEVEQKDRNVKKLSIDSYIPNGSLDYKKHSLFINTSPTKINSKNTLRKDIKVDFIKLPNLVEVQPYGFPSIPLTVELSAQNLLDNNAVMNINLRGYKQLNTEASLAYYAQVNYNKSYFSNDPFRNAAWYVGYYDDVKTIEIGQITGNIIGLSSTGYGLKASYKYLNQHKTSVFYLNNDRNTLTTDRSFGLSHTYTPTSFFKIKGSVARNERKFQNRNTNVFSIEPSLKFLKKHFITFLGALSTRTDDLNKGTVNGISFGTTYSANFLNRSLKVNFNGRYNDKNFSLGSFERLYINHRSDYIINKKWSVNLNNFYQNVNLFSLSDDSLLSKQEVLFNSIIFNTNTRFGNLQPGLYYELTNYPLNRLISRGASLRASKFDFTQNFFSSLNLKAGYSIPQSNQDEKNFFSLQMSLLLRYRVWNFNVKYDYGFITSTNTYTQLSDNITPQSIRLSLQNQYAFKNRHLVLDNNIVYSYINIFKNHSIGLFPILYYFTDSGWRFSINSSYSFSTRNFTNLFGNNFIGPNNNTPPNTGTSINSDFTLGFSLKKDFGIPIPFLDKTAATINIKSFYDLNGDGNQNSRDEGSISNVVVRIGNYEIITNDNGKAIMKNIPQKKYALQVIPLDKLEGWFPNVNDSIIINSDGLATIPFVRGVKISGDIVLDRQKIAIIDEKPVDLSRIKISAFSSKTVFNTLTDKKGHFEFYLPNGKYIVTMDEKVLGTTYRLARNNIPVTLKNSQEGMYVSFYVVERRRKVIIKDFNKKN
jgi:hypothetical protein